MFQSITFYVGEKTLGIYGEEFPLGTLTTEVLNITPEEYQALDVRLKAAIETSLDKGTQRKTTENELPSLTQCTA